MEKTMKTCWLALVLTVLCATAAFAEWGTVAEVVAGSQAEATELAVNRYIRTVEIECTSGSVLINTLWVREGAAKTEIRVARRFNAGEKQDIDLGTNRNVTGFRISNQGPGKFKVHAK